MKPIIVLSGVNFTEMGPLSVFKEAIASLTSEYASSYDIVALVHRKNLFNIPGVKLIEFPEVKSSWLKRLRFEYRQCHVISREFKPYLWFAMHDMTPNVIAGRKAVYCHNPSPFYPFSMKEALLDWKFGLFTLFYRFLYGFGIRSNDFVVVQQDWLRKKFQLRYGVRNVIVSHPSLGEFKLGGAGADRNSNQTYSFFFPAYPRTFKNVEVILKAARGMERRGLNCFEVWLTMDGRETPYAAKMRREYSDLRTVKWMGLQPREEVIKLYEHANCLLFPSKLETWGMPITEFKVTRKPILVADLPYAHETVGQYDKAAFFSPEDDEALSMKMSDAISGVNIFAPHAPRPIAEPFSHNWSELWRILLADKEQPVGPR